MAGRTPIYASRGLAVETYDVRIPAPDQPPIGGDVEFYSSLAQRANGPVLELGAGTGRVVWALAEAGFEVVGLDVSGPMLERAEAKRASVPMEAGARATSSTPGWNFFCRAVTPRGSRANAVTLKQTSR